MLIKTTSPFQQVSISIHSACSELNCGFTADSTGAPGRSCALDSEPLCDISYRLTVIYEL